MANDSLLLLSGMIVVATSIGAIRHPDQNALRRARLNELEAGAPEEYFEERRALESYPPRFNLSKQKVRVLGLVGLFLGVAMIVWSFIRSE